MTQKTISDDQLEFWVLIHQTSEAAYKAREKELRPHGLSPIAHAVLTIASRLNGQATAAELSRWLMREPHSVSELLSRMEKGGLLRRTKDPRNRQWARIKLTKKGQRLLDMTSTSAAISRMSEALSEEQRQQLIAYLREMMDRALQELGREGESPFPWASRADDRR